jgi:uncharacterized small protein (DUF1192 family)
MKSTKNLDSNIVFFGRAPHSPLMQRTSLLPPLAKIVKKCYNLNLNLYSTNLANMEAMKREIARLNAMLGKKCMESKKAASGKDD